MNYVIGAGAVGTFIAGYLTAAGHQPTLVVRPQRRSNYDSDRLRIDRPGAGATMRLPSPRITSRPAYADASRVFICTKRAQLPDVAASLAGQLPDNCLVLPCVNGVGAEQVIAQALPGQPCAPVYVMSNMRVVAPLHIQLNTAAELIVETTGRDALKLFRGTGLKARAAAPGSGWGKLLINLNNAIGALCQSGFTDMFAHPQLRQAYLLCLDEAVATLEAAGQPYTMPAPVSYGVYRWLLARVPALPLWVARRKNGLSDEAYPSMCVDLEAGRVTEVGFLNGAVVDLAARLDRRAPVNQRVVELVEARHGQTAPTPLDPAALLEELQAA
ncbi:MAG: hypothetical protein CMN28_16225 [Salinisphaeraceae bacterium]|nr:hypothetical protein [Salinisphaeraceae bacterium]